MTFVCSPDCHGAGDLLVSAYSVLGLKVCTTTTQLKLQTFFCLVPPTDPISSVKFLFIVLMETKGDGTDSAFDIPSNSTWEWKPSVPDHGSVQHSWSHNNSGSMLMASVLNERRKTSNWGCWESQRALWFHTVISGTLFLKRRILKHQFWRSIFYLVMWVWDLLINSN